MTLVEGKQAPEGAMSSGLQATIRMQVLLQAAYKR